MSISAVPAPAVSEPVIEWVSLRSAARRFGFSNPAACRFWIKRWNDRPDTKRRKIRFLKIKDARVHLGDLRRAHDAAPALFKNNRRGECLAAANQRKKRGVR